MNTRDLKALVVLAEELHFGRAAERLGIVQPVLSELIRRVESRAGVTAFVRRPRVLVTEAGELLVRAAERALWQIDQGMLQAKLVADGAAGIVRVGLVSAATLTDVPFILRKFSRATPGLQLQLMEAPSAMLHDRLKRGELDIIISRDAIDATPITCVRLLEDQVEVVVPVGHPAANLNRVSLPSLRAEEFIFFRRSDSAPYYDRIMSACRAVGFVPNVTQEIETWAALLAMVRAGFGITLGTATLRRAQFPGVVFCPIREAMPTFGFYMSFDPRRTSPLAEKLAGALQEKLVERL